MKSFFFRLLVAWTFVACVGVKAAEASDEYVSIYSLITKGDEMLGSDLRGEAAQFYSDAHRKLVAFKRDYPGWNEQVVRFRLKYLGEKLAGLPAISPEPLESVPAIELGVATDPSAPSATRTRLLEGQVGALSEQLRQLTADNSLLLSKLREAMSARPASVDPSQVRKAEAKILELEKENELIELQLRRALESKTAVATANPENDEVAALRERYGQLQSDRVRLQAQVDELGAELSRALGDSGAGTQRTQTAQAGEVTRLTAERDQLLEQMASLKQGDDTRDTIEELMRENARLRRQAASPTEPVGPATNADEKLLKRLSQLEKENRQLGERLSQQRSGEKSRLSWLPGFGRRGSKNITVMEARLAVLEAEKAPYTSEELALLKGAQLAEVSGVMTANSSAASAPTAEISQAAAALEAAAQQAAESGDFATAESKYDEILDLIPNHAPSLASLALTQLKQEKLGEAEANLEMALEIAPENTYALFLSGLLKMGQNRFDEAVTYLSRATVLDPDDAEAQSHLGIALTEVGHRGPAEAALRKAIRLRPGYAEAHINLAVVYASQDPPFRELAKYHYQQAMNSGHPADPRIEQLIDKN